MKLLRDWVWIGLWASLLGTGCASANRESAADVALAEAAPTEAELDDQLTADRLRPRQLRALEVRAQQKLRDFYDYLNLVGNPSLDSTFRAEAARQALLLFADPAGQRAASSRRALPPDDDGPAVAGRASPVRRSGGLHGGANRRSVARSRSPIRCSIGGSCR